jgi:hypothetical protein
MAINVLGINTLARALTWVRICKGEKIKKCGIMLTCTISIIQMAFTLFPL